MVPPYDDKPLLVTAGPAEFGEPRSSVAGLHPIANSGPVLGAGLEDLRRVALDVTAAGIRAADPTAAVDRLVVIEDGMLKANGHPFSLHRPGSVVLLGAGKASVAIAAALEAKLGDRLSGGLIVRRRGERGRLHRVEIMDADHPIPGQASLEAGRRLMEAAAKVRPGDLVITAFTGGSSALACLPPEGVPFAAKQRLHSLLLESGASIAEINTVRKHVSALKGGRLAATMPGSTLLNLTVSDAIGDAVDLLCDPVVQDSSDPPAALAVLRRYGIWQEVAPEIRDYLVSPPAVSPVLAGRVTATTVVLLNGSHVAAEMAVRARTLGWEPVILGSTLEGDAGQLGSMLGSLARESSINGQPFRPGSILIGAGGESTVALRLHAAQETGHGGPNQQLALVFARAIGGSPGGGRNQEGAGEATSGRSASAVGGPPVAAVAGAFVDSDGSDGGTDAAGGCVDSTTVLRARASGVDLDAAINGYDAYPVLRDLGDLVITGPTGTNVSDLWTIAIGTCRPHGIPEGKP